MDSTEPPPPDQQRASSVESQPGSVPGSHGEALGDRVDVNLTAAGLPALVVPRAVLTFGSPRLAALLLPPAAPADCVAVNLPLEPAALDAMHGYVRFALLARDRRRHILTHHPARLPGHYPCRHLALRRPADLLTVSGVAPPLRGPGHRLPDGYFAALLETLRMAVVFDNGPVRHLLTAHALDLAILAVEHINTWTSPRADSPDPDPGAETETAPPPAAAGWLVDLSTSAFDFCRLAGAAALPPGLRALRRHLVLAFAHRLRPDVWVYHRRALAAHPHFLAGFELCDGYGDVCDAFGSRDHWRRFASECREELRRYMERECI